MYLVNIKKQTVQKCIILEKKSNYTILQIDNEIFGLPTEDKDHYLCDDYKTACSMVSGCWFVAQ